MPVSSSRVGPASRNRRWINALATVMLLVTVTLTALLWFRAVPMTVSAVETLTSQDVVEVTATGCDNRGTCTVRWPQGEETPERTLDAPGLFAPENGSQIKVIDNEGQLERAGWARFADAGLMAFLALGLTGLSLNWFRRVLNTAPIMPDDYGILEPLESIIARQQDAADQAVARMDDAGQDDAPESGLEQVTREGANRRGPSAER